MSVFDDTKYFFCYFLFIYDDYFIIELYIIKSEIQKIILSQATPDDKTGGPKNSSQYICVENRLGHGPKKDLPRRAQWG